MPEIHRRASDDNQSKILIVQNQQTAAADLQATLESLGFEVVATVGTGQQAIGEAEQSRPDLVLMDIQAEGPVDGIAAAAEIRRLWSIPVVFATSNSNDETLTRARATGPYGYIVKPFRAADLNATIQVALNLHRALRVLFAGNTWLLTVLGGLSDAVIATDDHGCVRYMNAAAEEITGHTLIAAFGKRIEDIYSVAALSGHQIADCQIRKALASMAAVPKQRFLLTHSDGRKTAVEDLAAPIVTGGRLVGAVTVFADVTERIRREREQELERDKLEDEIQIATEALGHTRSELLRFSAHLMTAQEEERRRMSRELHDDFAQRLALLDMQVEQFEALIPVDQTGGKLLNSIRSQTRQLAKGLRDASHRLYPSVLNDLGLVAGLRQLADSFRDSGVDVSLKAQLQTSDVPTDVAVALYRITQEALRNIAKHSPQAPAQIILAEHDGVLQLSVEDAGPGFDVVSARARGGLGIIGMQERARLTGGSLLLRTAPGSGTQIIVRVPVQARP